MRFRQLHEDGYDAGDDAVNTLNKFGGIAKKAFDKFAHKKKEAEGDIRDQARVAIQQQKNAARRGEVDAARADKEAELHKLAQSSAGAGQIVAQIANDIADPTPEGLPELEGFDAKMFANFQKALNDVDKRMEKVPAAMRKLLTSNFLTANYQKPKELNDIMQELSVDQMRNVEKHYFASPGVSETLKGLVDTMVNSDSAATVQQAMLKWLREVDKENQKFNDGQVGKQKPARDKPVGPRLAQVLRGIVQLVHHRVVTLREVANKLEAMPQKRTKDSDYKYDDDEYDEPQFDNMRESLTALRGLLKRL